MSDYLLFENMLKNKVNIKTDFSNENISHWRNQYPEVNITINVYNSKKIGYNNYMSTWLFDINGCFIAVGHYEE